MAFSLDLNPIAGGILNGGVIIGGIAFIGVIFIGLIFILKNQKKFDYTTIIYEKDAFGKPIMKFGKGGIFLDKKVNYKRFWLQNSNASLSADKVPYIQSPKNKYVFLRKIGNKDYEYISFENLFDTNGKINIGEEDINSAIIDYEKTKQVFGTSLLDKILPYLPLIISGVFVIGLVYITLQKLPELISAMNALADKLTIIAQTLARVQPPTVVK
jgi:hypothetical protein